jgi:hypothetical protein
MGTFPREYGAISLCMMATRMPWNWKYEAIKENPVVQLRLQQAESGQSEEQILVK